MTSLEGNVAPPVAHFVSWSERNQQWLIAAIARLRSRIEAHGDTAGDVADSVAADTDCGFTPALIHCAQVFGLSPFERELLLLSVGLELDSGLRAALAALNHGSPFASYGSALALLTQPHWDALSPEAPLRYWRIAEPESGSALAQAPLRADERIVHFITGVTASDTRLSGIARHVPAVPGNNIDVLLARRVAQSLRMENAHGRVVVLHGETEDTGAQRDLALAAAAELGRPILWIAAHDLPTEAGELVAVARRVDREGALTGAIPVLAIGDTNPETAAISFVARLLSAVLWLGAPHAALKALPDRRRVARFELPAHESERDHIGLMSKWRKAAPPTECTDESVGAELARVAGQFHLSPAAMDDLVENLISVPAGERGGAVWGIARELARGGLDALAQRIETRVDFDDLVLPPAQIAILRDIARQLRNRERVYRDWGFGEKHARGQGLTALFSGESGTGKTLAAEAIANKVGLDLYRVDLAMLVSKYIGETEKNLKRLFDAAETSGAVLLFDEADALFGKRSEAKDSHDRYANIEVSYLLQRIESYRGLAILTTNMKSALDRAFLRRIRFVISFPFPDAPARERIWRKQFPDRVPLGSIDFSALARLNLAGGNIHSIVLNAAFRAADGAGRIDQSHLMEAARAEYAKLERSFTDGMGGGT